jgi:tetratricopeptide (TPR) repeat protein
LPGCEVSVNGTRQENTDENGELILAAPRGPYTILVSKPGYESSSVKVSLKCDETESKDVSLKPRLTKLQFRTSVPDCEIFINDPPARAGRSDEKGLFSYPAIPPTLFIEARKPGYITATLQVAVTPDVAQKEIPLRLKPIPSLITLSANVEAAHVRLDNQETHLAITEPLSVSPGRHSVTVDALGYEPSTFEVSPGPGETVRKSVTLARLPVEALITQAQSYFDKQAYENVLTLCRYIFEVEARHPAASRLMGLAYLARQNYDRARNYLAQALAGDETVQLPVRRHPREEFDPAKNHDICEAQLILGKKEFEFRGLRAPADNFKVAYAQVQIIGIQLKKGAVYLGTKVMRAPGKKQDFNFYSSDKELSQAGKPYLEMLLSLLQAH